jgi:GNAT superfamily N-acetyltransferase
MIVVRRIRPGEADALRLVRLAALAESPSAFGSTYAGESSLTIEDWADRAHAGSDGSERATFFAVANEDIVGLVGGYRTAPASETVELVSMWTNPTVRRAGVGRLLVNAVLEWARACGAREVQLWVTRGNTAAEILYRAMGFTETGDYQPLPSDPCQDETRMAVGL